MAEDILVPEVSEGVSEGKVISLLVAVGDRVDADQTLLELETDKAIVAIPSPFAGTITAIQVAEGDALEIGAKIMSIEALDSASVPPPAPAQSTVAAPPSSITKTVATESPQPVSPPPPLAPPPPTAAAKEKIDLRTVRTGDAVAPAPPNVRRLARELGVDIYQVQGQGPGGRISAEDVRSYVQETMHRLTGGGTASHQPSTEFLGLHAQRPLPDFSKWGEVSREPLSRVREITADAMSYAWSTVPMVTQYDETNITDLEDFRGEFNRRAAPESKLTMTAILVKVCAAALRAFPQFNSSLDLATRELVLKQSVHIGVAVDTPGGLLVPVIRNADRKGIEHLATELNATASKTRERRIDPAELEGGTFTISNLGGIGGTGFTPLVYAPQVAILGVSRATRKPVWRADEFQPELVMPLSLTYDHRVIDGADGARFLRWICAAIERPLHLVMKG